MIEDRDGVVVEMVGVSKAFPGVQALDRVNLRLHSSRTHALVGENGAGKSTLMNLLSGVLLPDAGEIQIFGYPVHLTDARSARRHGIVTVHQETDLFADLSVMENIGLEQGLPTLRWGWVRWREQRRRTEQALAAVGHPFSADLSAGALSPAQRQLAEIAAAVTQDARVLILDEPTSSLSEAEAQVLFRHLRRFRESGTAIVYISHRLEEVFALADEVTVLRDGQQVWSGAIGETSSEDLVRLMVGREVAPALKCPDRERGAVRLACRRLTAQDGSFRDVTLQVHAGEILGLYGLIGAGRSEWAQAVFGLRALASGEVILDEQPLQPGSPGTMARRGLIYLPEDRLRQGLCHGLSVQLNTVLASLHRWGIGGWMSTRRERNFAREITSQLRVRLHSLLQPVGTLSGGNQQKVVLGRWLGCEPGVLILDEPTRGVDVGAKAEIHTLMHQLAEEGRAIVLISSELPEVVAHSDRVAVFREGALVAEFDPRLITPEDIGRAALPTTHTGELDSAQETVSKVQKEGAGYRSRPWFSWLPSPREFSLLVIVLVFFLLLHVYTGQFLAIGNIRNMITDAALLSVCAVGVAVVLLAGGLDISLGALMALSAAVAGKMWEQGKPFPLVLLTALVVGTCGGLTNAGLSLIGRVHPIVITLGTMSLYRGLTLWWLGVDAQVPGTERNWLFAEGDTLPPIAWLGLGLVTFFWVFLNRTLWGREIYAFGSNPVAAHRVSIERRSVWLRAFAIQGMLAGLAGLLYFARSGKLQPTSYEDKTLQAIAAAVVGGVAITGGRGSVWGVALGCLFLVSLAPACLALHIDTVWQQTLVGSVMAVAVLTDTLLRGKD